MEINLKVITTTVALALQSSEGPFDILIRFVDNTMYEMQVTKAELAEWTNYSQVVEIDMTNRISSDRRWRQRPGDDRRN